MGIRAEGDTKQPKTTIQVTMEVQLQGKNLNNFQQFICKDMEMQKACCMGLAWMWCRATGLQGLAATTHNVTTADARSPV